MEGPCLSAVAKRLHFGGVVPEYSPSKCLDIVTIADRVLQGNVQGLHSVLWDLLPILTPARQPCAWHRALCLFPKLSAPHSLLGSLLRGQNSGELSQRTIGIAIEMLLELIGMC